jgi:hypothetical protein
MLRHFTALAWCDAICNPTLIHLYLRNDRPMIIPFNKTQWLLAATALLSASCADLGAIKNFAATSADAATYSSLTREWVNSAARQGIDTLDESLADSLDKITQRRQQMQTGLMQLHAALADYMAVLGRLAGDDTATNSSSVTGLASALQKTGIGRIKPHDLNAASALADTIATAIKDRIRQRALRNLIREGNAPVQTLTSLMRSLVIKDYQAGFRREIHFISDSFMGYDVMAKTKEQRMNPALKLLKERDYERTLALQTHVSQCDAYDQTLKAIAEGHQALYDNLDKLNKKEVIQLITTYNGKVKTLHNSIKALR